MKEAALQMFTSVPGVFGNEQNNYLDLIKQMMLQSLQPTEPFEVRFQAVRAVGAFILVNDKETQILKHFGDLLGPMLQIIAETVHQQDDDTLLKVLIDLAENAPKFLRPQLLPIYELCMKIFSDSGALDSWRQLSLEVINLYDPEEFCSVLCQCHKYAFLGNGNFVRNGTRNGEKKCCEVYGTISSINFAVYGRFGGRRWLG